MKTIKYEVKLETAVKIILGVLALGIFLNAFATPIAKELFGTKDAHAQTLAFPYAGQGQIHRVTLCDAYDQCGYRN